MAGPLLARNTGVSIVKNRVMKLKLFGQFLKKYSGLWEQRKPGESDSMPQTGTMGIEVLETSPLPTPSLDLCVLNIPRARVTA